MKQSGVSVHEYKWRNVTPCRRGSVLCLPSCGRMTKTISQKETVARTGRLLPYICWTRVRRKTDFSVSRLPSPVLPGPRRRTYRCSPTTGRHSRSLDATRSAGVIDDVTRPPMTSSPSTRCHDDDVVAKLASRHHLLRALRL